MKPCSRRQQSITWLTLDALPESQVSELRRHLAVCPGCRRYLDEISQVARRISAADSTHPVEATETFHRRLTASLHTSGRRTEGRGIPRALSASISRWRWLWVSLAGAAALIVAAVIRAPERPAESPAQIAAIPQPTARIPEDPQGSGSTLARYHRLVGRSWAEFDAQLTHDATHHQAPAVDDTPSILSSRATLD